MRTTTLVKISQNFLVALKKVDRIELINYHGVFDRSFTRNYRHKKYWNRTATLKIMHFCL